MCNIGDLVIITDINYPVIMLGILKESNGAIYDYNILLIKCSVYDYDGIGYVWKFNKEELPDITIAQAPVPAQLLYSTL